MPNPAQMLLVLMSLSFRPPPFPNGQDETG
jgi:hypothetical protein